jgi:hypothetical protein
MSKLKISKIAAAVVLGSAFFAGCNVYDVKSAPSTSFTAADGYVINLDGDNATATCGSTVYNSTSTGLLVEGKIDFAANLTADCTIAVKSTARIDANDNGVDDGNVIDPALGFELKAPGDAKVVSQLTTLVVAKKAKIAAITDPTLKAAAQAEIDELAAAVNDYNPVKAASTIAANDTSTAGAAQVALYKKLAVLAEVLKVTLKTPSVTIDDVTDITTTTYTDTTTDVDTLDVEASLPATSVIKTNVAIKNAVVAKATATKEVVKILKDIDTAKIDVNKLLVAISDAGKTLTEAVAVSSAVAGTTVTVSEIAKTGTTIDTSAIETAITTAKEETTKSTNSVPTLTLGNTLTIGGQTITMNADGKTFAATVANSSKTLLNFLTVTLPTVTPSATFAADTGVTVTLKVTDSASNMVSLSIAGVTLEPNGTSVKVTIPRGATLTATQSGLSNLKTAMGGVDTLTALTDSEQVNTDLNFNLNTISGNLTTSNSAYTKVMDSISALNSYFATAGKTYTLELSVSGLDNVAVSTSKITGTITVQQ